MNDLDHIERNQIEIMRALAALIYHLTPPHLGQLAATLLEHAADTQAFLDLKMKPIQ